MLGGLTLKVGLKVLHMSEIYAPTMAEYTMPNLLKDQLFISNTHASTLIIHIYSAL